MKIDDVHALPYEVRFSFTKKTELGFNALQGYSFLFYCYYCYYYYYCCLILINVNYLFEAKHLRQLFNFFLLLLCFTYHFGYVNGWQSYNTTKLPQGRVNEYHNSLLLSCLETACCDSIRRDPSIQTTYNARLCLC